MAWYRIKKRWLLLLVTVSVIAVLYAVAHRVLRNQVAAQFTDAFGGEVEIGSVSLGTRWHEARNVRVRTESQDRPWLTVDRVRFELPLTEAVAGSVTPRRLEVTGLEAHVRLGKDGRLIEPRIVLQQAVGGPLPDVSISDARVVVQQLDRAPVVLESIDATINSTVGPVRIVGEVGESPVGALAGTASYDSKANTWEGSIQSTSLQFDTDTLLDLPFSVPAMAAWRDQKMGRARGTATATVSFAVGQRGQITYRAELQVADAELTPADGEFQITQVAGRVVVKDNVVTLSDCRGEFASGTIAADGRLDLRADSAGGEFSVQLTDVALPLRRASGSLLPGLTGVASGRLRLQLQREAEDWVLSGTGEARLHDAVWDGLPVDTLTASLELKRWQPAANTGDARATGELQLGFAVVDAQLKQLAATFAPADDQLVEFVSGSVSIEGQLGIPLQTAEDPESYWAVATVDSKGMTVAKTVCGPLSARATLQQGRMAFEDAVLQFSPSGRVVVSGDVALAAGDSRLGLVLQRLPLRVAGPYIEQAVELAGDMGGELAVTIPNSTWHAPEMWQLTGSARSDVICWGDVTLEKVTAGVSYGEREFRLENVRCQVADVSVEGEATCAMAAPFAFDVQLRTPNVELQRVLQTAGVEFPLPLTGVASGQGRLSGSWKPLQWTGTGTAVVENAKLGDVAVSKIMLPWKVDKDRLEIVDASAHLLGGTVHMTAVVPLRDTAASRIEGRFDSWDVERLSRQLAWQDVSLQGSGSGRFSAQKVLLPETIQADLTFAGVDAVIHGVRFRQVTGRIEAQDGAATAKLDSRVLGGTCGFQGQSTIGPADWRLHQVRGKATLSQVQLQNLWPAIGQQQRYGALHAVADAQLDVQLSEPDTPAGVRGTLRLAQVRWGNVPITRELSAKMVLSEKQLRIEDARLRIDQGTVVGNATVNPVTGRGEFRVRVEQVPLRGLLAFAPNIARGARGKVNGNFSGSLGERWDAVGVLRLDRGSVKGVPLTAVRIPLRMTRVPDSNRTRLDVELQSARIASGRAKGRLQLSWSGRFAFEGAGELVSADLRPISRAVPGVSDLLGGQLSAKVDLKSGNARSVEDLIGHFDIRLRQSQALLLPGLKELTTAVGAPSPGAVTFSETIMRGDIGRGVVKVDQMTMESPDTRMWINGKMDLQGTLDFEVAADAGSMSTINLVAATVNPMQLLRRRLVFFDLEGSLRNPVVHPRTEEFLAQEVILFFLPVVSLR